MKKYLYLLFILIFFAQSSFAGSINAAAYQTMRAQSYRNNYYRQTQNNRVVPYWQAQSNFATRGRTYQNYANYTRYMNNSYGYNNYRSFR